MISFNLYHNWERVIKTRAFSFCSVFGVCLNYTFDSMEESTQQYVEKQIESKEILIKSVAENLVGNDALIDGPFEPHKQTYADYAASGKAVKFIEDYITKEVLPVYSNTHTSSSFVGIQTSCFREEARGIIRDTVHVGSFSIIRSITVPIMMLFSLQGMEALVRLTHSFVFLVWSVKKHPMAYQNL